MRILVVNSDCIFTNTSANLCHQAYIHGLCDAGHQVEVLCSDSQFRQLDPSMKLPQEVQLHTYPGLSLYEKLSIRKYQKTVSANAAPPAAAKAGGEPEQKGPKAMLRHAVCWGKRQVLSLYGVHGVYATFVKKARKFRSDRPYDYVLSLSTPVSSHLLAYHLIHDRHIQTKHWIQIWEDPWYSDAYGDSHKKKVFAEEQRLLSFADRVCYVSPLTLQNQKKLFPESADKMFWQPLPYYYKEDSRKQESAPAETTHYGYFGDYIPIARNLEPFYQAAREMKICVDICGSPCNLFPPTDTIHIHPRLPLQELRPIEDQTNVLIFLCNRKGGQIPGKIYQYSATTKTVLFILDGTPEEQRVLREYFEPLNRYVFCQNQKDDIIRAIRQIESGELGAVQNQPLECFNPVATIGHILSDGQTA